jgi:hypothetical protein
MSKQPWRVRRANGHFKRGKVTMRQFTRWVLAAGLLVAFSAAAPAADKPTKSPEVRFSKLDKNGDQKLSLEEYIGKKTEARKEKAEKRFARCDKDADKALSLEEFKTPPKKKKDKQV